MSIVPFNPGQAPAFAAQVHLTPDQIKAMNAAAAIGTGGSATNKLSLKQSRFRLIVGGQETAVLPVLDLNLVIVRVNEAITKTWFEKEWNPNDEPTSPECSSDDGIRPRSDSPKPQSDFCASCPQNQWGSKINRVTGGKIKACTDTKRMAVMAPDNAGRFAYDGDLYQLQIPPASLKDFGGFVRGLSAGSVPAGYNMVVANIAFDTTVSYPKLLFKPVRWLEADEWEHVSARFDSDEAQTTAGLAEVAVMRAPVSAPAIGHQPQHLQQAPVQQAPVQQAPVQQAQGGWGGAPAQQAPAQQAQGGWGGAPAQQAPAQQAPAQQVPAQQGGWGEAPVQQEYAQSPAQSQPVRERGKPMPGKARRTPAEIAEDKAADERDAAAAGGAPVQQAPAQQAPGGWGGAPVQQAPVQQAPVQQAPVQQAPADPSNPWGGAPGAQGAPNQPGVVSGDVAAAFAGWDD